jgi:hypothetical protein
MPGVGDLRVRLGLETKKFNKSLKGIKRKLGGIQTLIAGAFAAAGVSKLVRFGRAAIDAGDKLTKLRDSLGETTDFLQFLDYAAQRSGSNLDTLSTGVQRAKRRMSEFAKTGRGELAPVMNEMSQEFQTAVLAGEDFEAILPILARDISSLATDGDKLRVAMKLFDSEGARPFLQFLKAGPEGVEDLKKNFIDLGGAIEEHTLDAMADMNDRFTDISFSLKRAFIPALETLLPLLEEIARILAENAKPIAEFFDFDDQAARFGSKGPQGSWWPKGTPRRTLGPGESPPRPAEQIPDWEPGGIGPAMAPMIGPSLPPDFGIPPEDAKQSGEDVGKAFDSGMGPELAALWESMSIDMDGFATTVEERMGTMAENLADTFMGVFEGFTAGVGDAVGQAVVFGESMAESMKNLMKNIAAFIISQLTKMVVKKILLDRVSQASTKATSLTEIMAFAGKAFAATFSWWSGVFAPIAPVMATIAGAAALAGGLAFMAEGGIVTSPTLAMIGEAGPEAVIPLNRGGLMGPTTIVVELDGQVLASSTVEHMPGVLRLQGIGS